jgi:hypothetical protein
LLEIEWKHWFVGSLRLGPFNKSPNRRENADFAKSRSEVSDTNLRNFLLLRLVYMSRSIVTPFNFSTYDTLEVLSFTIYITKQNEMVLRLWILV